MGDRGGTATEERRNDVVFNYTRWEIGGEPQLEFVAIGVSKHYTRWEIGGEPQLGIRAYSS